MLTDGLFLISMGVTHLRISYDNIITVHYLPGSHRDHNADNGKNDDLSIKDGDHKKHSYRAAHTYRDHIWEYPTLLPGYRVGCKGAAPSYFSSDFFFYSPLQVAPSPENPDLQVHW